MSELHSTTASARRTGYAASLFMGTIFSGAAGAALWMAQHQPADKTDPWVAAAVAAGLLAIGMTVTSTFRLSRGASRRRNAADGDRDLQLETDASLHSMTPSPQLKTPLQLSAANRAQTERERLRADGYNEAEISQIMIAREIGGGAGTGGFGHGVMSGLLSNLTAAVAYARNFLPSLMVDFSKMLNARTRFEVRMAAFGSVVFKLFVIGVLACLLSLEYSLLRAHVDKARAEACIERQKNAINFSTVNELRSGGGPSIALNRECRGLL